MAAELEFFFDYGSPYSYLADTRLPELSTRTGCIVRYRPMLLGGVFKATGNRSPFFEPVEAKREYGAVELRRWIAHYGVPLQMSPAFPINTLPLMRLAHAAQRAGVFPAFHAAVYPAFWAEGQDLGDLDVITSVLRGANLDAEALGASAAESTTKQSLRDTTDEAIERGVFGAPTFFVGNEMFFGNDRLAMVELALGRSA